MALRIASLWPIVGTPSSLRVSLFSMTKTSPPTLFSGARQYGRSSTGKPDTPLSGFSY